ncbi:putative short-chain dehydrogenase reductase sdr protein [Ophiocordyceps camponoti-floridani]|uniref:Putative short-chain dehydrogenase reductase sdr protein n=1 Tax=Ophiocordyceps camponoti-floridani TaxID=2030778 RepID=A0A8H4Q2S7_9HYPO|nr:putative short-chain dehydrogenase reductase sdr protein [Ophiocordyceps camponoti-floridani]
MKPWLLVSPANRGLGLATARHLLSTTPHPLLATSRSTAESNLRAALLKDLPASTCSRLITVTGVDVTDEASVEEAARVARERFPPAEFRLGVGVVLPGVLTVEKSVGQVDYERALWSFRVNTLGPLLLAKHFLGFLPRESHRLDSPSLPLQASLLLTAARLGSTSDNRLGGWPTYRASKAGVISLARTLDHEVRRASGDAAMVVAYHPGTVKTEFSRDFWGSVGGAGGSLLEDGVAAESLGDEVLP